VNELTLNEYQGKIDEWVQAYGVRYFSELTNLGILMEEVGEVARLMTRIYGEQSFKSPDTQENKPDLGDELADVLFVVGCIANQTGINLEEAVQRNLDKKTARDSTRHWDNPKLQDT